MHSHNMHKPLTKGARMSYTIPIDESVVVHKLKHEHAPS